MNSFLCRVMTLVFLLNCLTPATGWGQTSRRSSRSLDAQVTRQVAKAQQQQNNSPAAQFARADTAARTAHNERFAQADSVAAAAAKPNLDERTRQNGVIVAGSTRVALHPMPLPLKITNAQEFLKRVEKGEIPFEQLIEYADPLDPALNHNDLMTITYAAEVIGNNISQLSQLDDTQYDAAAVQKELVQIQARLLYRMAMLGFKSPSYMANTQKDPVSAARSAVQGSYANSIQKTMAVGTLRLTLLKLHQFYQQKGFADPAEEYQKQALVSRLKPAPKKQAVPENKRSLPAPDMAAVQKQAAQQVAQYGNLANFQKRFIEELKQAVANEPEEGSYDYQHLQILAEYAASYALEYKPEALKEIIKILDKGPQATDFAQEYAPILNAIFNTIFENTRYSTMDEDKTKQVLNLLAEFSDPQKYSLPTRVFALEAASLLYRPFNEQTLIVPGNITFTPFNLNKPDENLRQIFAGRVVALYCPLTNESTFGVQDYGLDSKQMQALADKLAYIYDGFYDISTAVISMPGQDPHQYPTQCKMVMKNEPNRVKKNAEDRNAFFYFTGEVVFWTFGGDVFMFLGTAFRLTRGAVVALPKAGKAFKLAPNGEKLAAFNAQVRDGAKFANWVYKNKKQQGYIVEAIVQKAPVRVEKEVVVENGVAKTVERIIEPVNEYKPITTTHQLEGKYSLWNPKRWVGMKPGDKVLGYRVTHMQPGFETTVGEMRFEKLVNGHFVVEPVDGLHSLQDIAQMTRRLQTADGSRFWFEQQPYWRGALNMAQAQQEQWTLSGLQSAFKNQMDMWIPLEKAAQQTGKISETTRWWNVTQWGAPKEWGELAAGKMWGEAVKEGGTSALMPIYVAPKTSFRTISQVALGQPGLTSVPGVANVADVLPGFYTSGADLASGNVYKQMFNAYFRPLNWEKTVAKTFLPDYLPTKTFWQSVQKNPVLGVQLAPQLLWRNRFAATTAFFGAWVGADHLLYDPFSNWMEGQATKDAQAEIAKYGDTFSPKQAKIDEVLLEEMGVDVSDKRAMDTYNSVLAAQTDQKDGTLMTAPIVVARRALGQTNVGEALGVGIDFIGANIKADYAAQAQRSDLNRALLHRNYNQFTKNKEEAAKWQKEQRAAIEQSEQEMLKIYAQVFAAAPNLKTTLHALYQTYAKEFLNATTDQEFARANERFNKQFESLLAQVSTWQGAMQGAEQGIMEAKVLFSELVTPSIEKQIRAAWHTYAQMRCSALRTNNTQAAEQANAQLRETLDGVYKQIYAGLGYGVDFDPNAAK